MSQETPIRIGIIGTGQVAQTHMKEYRDMPSVQMVACADLDPAAAERSAKEYGIANVYADFRQLLARDDIDAVDVCLHNNLHRPVTEESLAAGKHVYCEKPIAGSYIDGAAMVDAARASGKKLGVQLFSLYTDDTLAALELIQAGELGEIYHARSTGHRRRGRPFVDGYGSQGFVQKAHSAGGALYDMGVYHIAQMLYLLGNPMVERVSGKTYQKTAMDAERRQASNYDVEELGLGLVRFAGGLTLDIIEAWAIHLDPFEGSYLVGDRGGIRLSPFGFFNSVGHLEMTSKVDLPTARLRWNRVRGDGAFYASAQKHWIAALQGKVDLVPSAEIALNTMLISEAIYLSDSLGREVTTDEVKALSKSTALVA